MTVQELFLRLERELHTDPAVGKLKVVVEQYPPDRYGEHQDKVEYPDIEAVSIEEVLFKGRVLILS